MNKEVQNIDFLKREVELIHSSRTKVARFVNHTMVHTYFEIGRLIVEEQQQGQERAGYGESLLTNLSKELSRNFGRGFSVDNLEKMRKFYITYSKSETLSRKLNAVTSKSETVSRVLTKTSKVAFNLSWSHYQKLMRIEDIDERRFYELESAENNWSVRDLQRQFDSALYQRIVLSKDKQKVEELSKNGLQLSSPQDVIKEPYVLEFLGLGENKSYTESEFEQGIIDKLEQFLLELGKGFTFVARQKRISFDEDHFYIDLVFYNRILSCFVLIDLKIGKLKHQDLGQMQMYVNYFDRYEKQETENNTVGIILCRDKNDTLVEITLPENNNQIFASRYQTVLPSKEELRELIGEMKD